MKVVGLITEYNPFHNGHKYHINEAKQVTGADYVIAVMSGNFVQRGTPAIIDKYTRAEMALNNGVDLVLEIPVCYATGSAEYFAYGAVSLLDKLGIVDMLCFGSECGDIGLLNDAANFLLNTPASFDDKLQSYLKDGFTYPAARAKALLQSLKSNHTDNHQALSKVLTEPNNILGIEYVKAIRRLNSSIEPVTIQRISAHYHDKDLTDNKTAELNNSDLPGSALPSIDLTDIDSSRVNVDLFSVNLSDEPLEKSDTKISSATAIRKAIYSKTEISSDYFSDIQNSVPQDVYQKLENSYHITFPITEEEFSQIIKYKLLTQDNRELAEYMDITSDLADRLKKITEYNLSLQELTQAIKTKNMTLTRINRALIHLLLNLRTDHIDEYNKNGYTQYARVLGVKKESTNLLRRIERNERIPVITKVSKAEDQLPPIAYRMLSEDILAAHLYNQAVYEKYKTTIPNEYKHGNVLK